MHEIGHFLSLAHTHSGDDDGDLNDWAAGDGFDDTLNDEAAATAANINARYSGETQAKRDDLIFNRMFYHQPQDVFVWDQLQAIIETVNDARDPECRGEGFILRSTGNDIFNGKSHATSVATMARAATLSTSSNDVILIQGTINVPNGSVFSKPGV